MIYRVTNVSPIAAEYVEFDGKDRHIRYAADNWAWCVGESTEAVFDCEELEAAYQEFLAHARYRPT
jgi:hypothetical protein